MFNSPISSFDTICSVCVCAGWQIVDAEKNCVWFRTNAPFTFHNSISMLLEYTYYVEMCDIFLLFHFHLILFLFLFIFRLNWLRWRELSEAVPRKKFGKIEHNFLYPKTQRVQAAMDLISTCFAQHLCFCGTNVVLTRTNKKKKYKKRKKIEVAFLKIGNLIWIAVSIYTQCVACCQFRRINIINKKNKWHDFAIKARIRWMWLVMVIFFFFSSFLMWFSSINEKLVYRYRMTHT